MSLTKTRGFTLVELLVVMAILGILATVGLGSFYNSQKKGRDAQRKHDLTQIQNALEMYLNDKGRYPDAVPNADEEWRDTTVADGTLYMKAVPGDSSGENYCYEPDIVASKWYRIYAKLENSQDPGIEKSGCGGDPSPCSCGGDSYNYRVWSSNAP